VLDVKALVRRKTIPVCAGIEYRAGK
jgi:hypothetical protein